jgi:hypothetical protein
MDRTDKLIQAYCIEEGQLGLFKITGNNCPEDYLETVIKEYFEYDDEDNANLHLFRWGLERVYIDYEVTI